MNVYIVVLDVPYEFTRIMSVHKHYEGAVAEIKELATNSEDEDLVFSGTETFIAGKELFQAGNNNYTYEIEIHTLED